MRSSENDARGRGKARARHGSVSTCGRQARTPWRGETRSRRSVGVLREQLCKKGRENENTQTNQPTELHRGRSSGYILRVHSCGRGASPRMRRADRARPGRERGGVGGCGGEWGRTFDLIGLGRLRGREEPCRVPVTGRARAEAESRAESARARGGKGSRLPA